MVTEGHQEVANDVTSARAGPLPHPRMPVGGPGRPTVGLVTAIPEELVAMRWLVEHSEESNIAHDPAMYLRGTLPSRELGRSHEVVLTQLGATATNAAADGCAQLIRSFPTISVVVMVGIAAGVPNPSRPERHVRLGDIVVATQGVVDYDHVRAAGGTATRRRLFPLPSPRLVRCADMLKADELSGQRTWDQWLDPKGPPGLTGYGRPPDRSDALYDGAGRRLWHPRRNISGHPRGFPKVHYGLIGSGDRSFRDAGARDQIATEHEVLALEMESAGVGSSGFLSSVEWFAVRGISDYGDSYRDAAWRRYAALAAAAYVRELLAKCLPLEPRMDDAMIKADSHG